MIKGNVTCECGQYFDFETIAEFVDCPKCGKSFNTKEHEIIDVPYEEVVEVVESAPAIEEIVKQAVKDALQENESR